jgi:hypothetical protein
MAKEAEQWAIAVTGGRWRSDQEGSAELDLGKRRAKGLKELRNNYRLTSSFTFFLSCSDSIIGLR